LIDRYLCKIVFDFQKITMKKQTKKNTTLLLFSLVYFCSLFTFLGALH